MRTWTAVLSNDYIYKPPTLVDYTDSLQTKYRENDIKDALVLFGAKFEPVNQE